jgi:hypothetical protein
VGSMMFFLLSILCCCVCFGWAVWPLIIIVMNCKCSMPLYTLPSQEERRQFAQCVRKKNQKFKEFSEIPKDNKKQRKNKRSTYFYLNLLISTYK